MQTLIRVMTISGAAAAIVVLLECFVPRTSLVGGTIVYRTWSEVILSGLMIGGAVFAVLGFVLLPTWLRPSLKVEDEPLRREV